MKKEKILCPECGVGMKYIYTDEKGFNHYRCENTRCPEYPNTLIEDPRPVRR